MRAACPLRWRADCVRISSVISSPIPDSRPKSRTASCTLSQRPRFFRGVSRMRRERIHRFRPRLRVRWRATGLAERALGRRGRESDEPTSNVLDAPTKRRTPLQVLWSGCGGAPDADLRFETVGADLIVTAALDTEVGFSRTAGRSAARPHGATAAQCPKLAVDCCCGA